MILMLQIAAGILLAIVALAGLAVVFCMAVVAIEGYQDARKRRETDEGPSHGHEFDPNTDARVIAMLKLDK